MLIEAVPVSPTSAASMLKLEEAARGQQKVKYDFYAH